MINQSERRRSARKLCLVPVEGKAGSAFAQTQTIDISKSGIGFISKKKIPLNKKIAVELDLADQAQPALVMGQVKWVSRINRTHYYRIGMLLTDDLSTGSKTYLKDYRLIRLTTISRVRLSQFKAKVVMKRISLKDYLQRTR